VLSNVIVRNGGRVEPLAFGVGRGEKESAVIILDTVTGQVQEQQVIQAPVGEKLLELSCDLVRRLIDDRPHLKGPDGRIR
jgi:hypothetical protein